LDRPGWLDAATVLCLPALMLYLGFNAGGYFAGTTGWATAAMAVVLAVRIAISGRPIAGGVSARLVLAASVFTLFALWTLLSGAWSGNHGRALLEFDRALLYLLVLLVFGSIEQPRPAFRYLPLGFAAAAVVLCAAGLATRALPDVWPFSVPDPTSRLAYPVTYSNGLGILTALGITACLHLASWERERVVVRVAAAAAIPLLGATLVLTFSRGGILAAALGAAVYAAFGRPRGLLTAVAATLGPFGAACWAAYDAELLATREPVTAATIAQGHDLVRTVVIAMVAAGLLLALLMRLERRWAHVQIPRPPRALLVGVLAAGIAAVVVAAVIVVPKAVDSPNGDSVGTHEHRATALTRDRLADVGGQTRVQYWKVSLGAFADEPIIGTGVGTFEKRWDKHRPTTENVTEGHSIYLETLGELGLVGAGLIIASLVMLVAPFAVRCFDPRPLSGVGLALGVAWLFHAGIDWDWELPVLTVGFFAFGGCALAAMPARWPGPVRLHPAARVALVALCLVIAITPITIVISQARLDRSVLALERGDCAEATREATAARSALSVRYEPYEILAYCASRSGDASGSIALMDSAIDRDPDDWHLYYGLALMRAAAGQDPRAAASRALQLNPREELARYVVRRFATDDPRVWERRARTAPLPL
jgi:hypothetical protein